MIAHSAALGLTVFSIAGSGQGGFSDGVGTAAQFNAPAGLALDGNDNLVIADEQNKRIRRMTPDGAVTTLAGSEEGSFNDGPGPEAHFNNPTGVAVGPDGDIYVADALNGFMRRVASNGGQTSTLANKFSFAGPRWTAVDPQGGVYVTETDAGWISKVTATGRQILARDLSEPRGIALDSRGNMYVCDYGRQRIVKILPSGKRYVIAGNENYGVRDGMPGFAELGRPEGIAVDEEDYVYVADLGTHRIRVISPDGVMQTLAGGNQGFDDGPVEQARFDNPRGIAVTDDGTVYVGDRANHRIRKIAGVDPRRIAKPDVVGVRRDTTLSEGLLVPVGANDPGLLRIRVSHEGRQIAFRTIRFGDAGNRRVAIRLRGAARQSVEKNDRTTFEVSGTFSDDASKRPAPTFRIVAR